MDINTKFVEGLTDDALNSLENSITILIKELVNQNKTTFNKSELEEIGRAAYYVKQSREDK